MIAVDNYIQGGFARFNFGRVEPDDGEAARPGRIPEIMPAAPPSFRGATVRPEIPEEQAAVCPCPYCSRRRSA